MYITFCVLSVSVCFSSDDSRCRGFQWSLAQTLMNDLPWMSECLSVFLTDAFGSPLERLFFLYPKFLVFTVLVRLIGFVSWERFALCPETVRFLIEMKLANILAFLKCRGSYVVIF